ncbi:hypothetical protein JAAARDRAFT_127658 [Jaapia argillacea MUCL 33604]|uniref:Autophagy-related protein 17 n=1 Tax=Jaapia argillacea MUCL 33604 TaxID=933084 RepID=A0A067Q6F4_9AGAM|nr:hypothetical protein JAAARDRAFT_127658 [Jaapia argillacea MUCL 33604]
MSTPASPRPDLLSLTVQSKKALAHGQHLCSLASSLSTHSAQCALDVLALRAKVSSMSDAVLGQLKLAASVAKSIEFKRGQLEIQVKEWDVERTKHIEELDDILDSLGSRIIPPDFHLDPTDLSPFGSQHSSPSSSGGGEQAGYSPTITIRGDISSHSRKKRDELREDRSKWKTLRDFVDERAIEDTLEGLENDRMELEDVMDSTADYAHTITTHISTIISSLPPSSSIPSSSLPLSPTSPPSSQAQTSRPEAQEQIQQILESQHASSTTMARHLESLAAHFEQMSNALRESEEGEVFGEEDFLEMNRDTEELPAIISELEEDYASIEGLYERLTKAKTIVQEQVNGHRQTLDDLDELGEIMGAMLHRQQLVESETQTRLPPLQIHLLTLSSLHSHFSSYLQAYNRLLIEVERRRRYRDVVGRIVEGMKGQLDEMFEEESQTRTRFNEDHDTHLPPDLCLYLTVPPTRWDIVPAEGEEVEVVPEVEYDLLVEVNFFILGMRDVLVVVVPNNWLWLHPNTRGRDGR